MEYTAKIKKVEDGWYMGQCEQIPEAITQGQTIAEVKENLKEAITLVLEAEKDHCQDRCKGIEASTKTAEIEAIKDKCLVSLIEKGFISESVSRKEVMKELNCYCEI